MVLFLQLNFKCEKSTKFVFFTLLLQLYKLYRYIIYYLSFLWRGFHTDSCRCNIDDAAPALCRLLKIDDLFLCTRTHEGFAIVTSPPTAIATVNVSHFYGRKMFVVHL